MMKRFFLILHLKASIKKKVISVKQFQTYYFSAALLRQSILLQKLFNVIDFLRRAEPLTINSSISYLQANKG